MSRSAASSLVHDVSALALRLVFGGLMIVNHGVGKWSKLTSGDPIQFADPLGLGPQVSLTLAAGAELVCAALVVLGLFTRLNLVPLMFTMVIAVFVAHAGDPLARKEMGLLYLTAYGAMFVYGPGRLALSQVLLRAWKPKGPRLTWLLR